MFDPPPPPGTQLVYYTSVSSDSNRMVVIGQLAWEISCLDICDVHTGNCLATTTITERGYMPWFTPDGREVWCFVRASAKGWSIIEDSESECIGLEPLESTPHPSGGRL